MFSSPFWTGTYNVGRALSWPTTTLVYLFCRSFLCPFAPGAWCSVVNGGVRLVVWLDGKLTTVMTALHVMPRQAGLTR
jgi:hypothetical protein